jgi:hypothetical protein
MLFALMLLLCVATCSGPLCCAEHASMFHRFYIEVALQSIFMF